LLVSLLTIFFITFSLFGLQYHQPIWQVMGEILVCVSICGIIYYIGALPFEILMFTHPFWKKRFEVIFGLKILNQSEPEY
jgi:hypothetical protein